MTDYVDPGKVDSVEFVDGKLLLKRVNGSVEEVPIPGELTRGAVYARENNAGALPTVGVGGQVSKAQFRTAFDSLSDSTTDPDMVEIDSSDLTSTPLYAFTEEGLYYVRLGLTWSITGLSFNFDSFDIDQPAGQLNDNAWSTPFPGTDGVVEKTLWFSAGSGFTPKAYNGGVGANELYWGSFYVKKLG